MIGSIFIAIGTALITSGLFSYAFTFHSKHRLYSLECEVADLQDRHLRTVRKASADKRWQGEDEFDVKIASALTSTPAKTKRWMKWDSSRNSNSAKSLELPSEDTHKAGAPD